MNESPGRVPLKDRVHRARVAPGSAGSKRRNRGYDFLCRNNSAGVVRHVDVKRRVHHLVRVVRRPVLHHGDLIAKFGFGPRGDICFARNISRDIAHISRWYRLLALQASDKQSGNKCTFRAQPADISTQRPQPAAPKTHKVAIDRKRMILRSFGETSLTWARSISSRIKAI
jgi:hypothetical protein